LPFHPLRPHYDVKKLFEVPHELVARGNMVVVIEHNPEVIKNADWVIDLGPQGGEIVAWGPPEYIAKVLHGQVSGAGAEEGARKPKRRSDFN
jgi:excinuclease ABC subunit A